VSRPYTVWLASYPKSGNTWVRAVLHALREPGLTADRGRSRRRREPGDVDLDALGAGPISSGRIHVDQLLGFSSSDLTPDEIDQVRPACDRAVEERLRGVHFRKIHDRLHAADGTHIVAADATRAAVYVVRDPRDVAVSFAHHARWSLDRSVAMLGDPSGALDNAPYRNGRQTRQRLGTWSDHVRSWLDQDLFPVLLLRYEDLHTDAVGAFGRLARFAGLDVSQTEVARAVAAARFERLRALESEHGFSERPRKAAPFFRRGVVGSWRDELPSSLERRIRQDHAAVMERLGYLQPVRAAR
jgi:hypothetical protein